MSYEKLIPVTQEEVLREAEDIEALCKTMNDWALKLQKQHAPQDLISSVLAALEKLEEVYIDIVELTNCFPKEE